MKSVNVQNAVTSLPGDRTSAVMLNAVSLGFSASESAWGYFLLESFGSGPSIPNGTEHRTGYFWCDHFTKSGQPVFGFGCLPCRSPLDYKWGDAVVSGGVLEFPTLHLLSASVYWILQQLRVQGLVDCPLVDLAFSFLWFIMLVDPGAGCLVDCLDVPIFFLDVVLRVE